MSPLRPHVDDVARTEVLLAVGGVDHQPAAVVDVDGTRVAYYDGRATYAENWEERTGLAVAGPDGRFTSLPDGPHAESEHATGALRYVDVLVEDSGLRLYYEASRADGAHVLLTEYAPLPG